MGSASQALLLAPQSVFPILSQISEVEQDLLLGFSLTAEDGGADPCQLCTAFQ